MGEMPPDPQVGESHEGGLLLDLSGAEAGTQSCVVLISSRSYRIGDPVVIEGQAPDGTYCAAVLPNGVWAIGDAAPSGTLSSVTVTSSSGVIPQAQIWVATALGSYDVLLLSQPCGAGGTIAAASEPDVTSGFQVVGEPIPAVSALGLPLFIALIALLNYRLDKPTH